MRAEFIVSTSSEKLYASCFAHRSAETHVIPTVSYGTCIYLDGQAYNTSYMVIIALSQTSTGTTTTQISWRAVVLIHGFGLGIFGHLQNLSWVSVFYSFCLPILTRVGKGLCAWNRKFDSTNRPSLFVHLINLAGATQVKWNRQDAHLLASSHDDRVLIWDNRVSTFQHRVTFSKPYL